MAEFLFGVLPMAVGIVLSPLAIVAVILLLLSPRPRTAVAFLAGWILGLAVVGGLTLLLAEAEAPAHGTGGQSPWVIVVQLALAGGLLYLAWRTFGKRPRGGEEARLPRWMQAVGSFPPARALAVAAAFAALKPKNLLLTIAAMVDLGVAGLPGGQTSIAYVAFVVLASLGIVGPVVYASLGGEAARTRLVRWRAWLVAHNAVLVAVVLAVLGVKVLLGAVSGIAA